jgi:methyl-accepting chemotaxis protein
MIMSFLHNLSIRKKYWLGFGPILGILTISSTTTLISLNQVKESINQVVHESQPRLILTENLAKSLKQSSESLGFYLLTKEQAHREDFSYQRDHAKYILQSLITKSLESKDTGASRLLKLLENELLQYQQTTETLLSETATTAGNFPGIAYANQHINPLNRKQMQLATQMILSEMEEPANKNRKQILHSLTELRHAWSNIINSIRGYIAFRNETNLNNLNLYLERTKSLLQQIYEKRNQLTLDQDDSIEQFMGNLTEFEAHYNILLDMHGSDLWRSDAWLIRNQITPLMLTIDQQLDQLVAHHQASISDTSTRLIDDTTSTISLVTGLLLLALLLGVSISWIGTRKIYNPINDAVNTMQGITKKDTVAEKASKATSAKADPGCRVIKQAMDAIHALADEVEVVEKPTLGVSRILSVLDVINRIAEQTNLLALNAVIEAARAGEHKREFAIVADKIRKLTNRTQQSTGKIESMIQRLQSGAQQTKDTSDIANELSTLVSELQRIIEQFRFSADVGFDLRSAKSVHLARNSRIRTLLEGNHSLSNGEAVSHQDCAIGKRYHAEAHTRNSDREEVHAIPPPHKQLHSLIKDIINHVERGDLEDAKALYNEIDPLSKEIISLLNSFQQQITNTNEIHY